MDINDYLDLIPPPNNIQPNFMDWMEGNMQPGVDGQDALTSIIGAFDIDLAVGDQLDVLGEILGVARQVTFNPGGGASAILPDDFYRVALKARIILNQWRGTKQEIYDFWLAFLPNYPVLIQDNQDMTMSVVVFGMENDLTGTYMFTLGPVGGAGPDGSILAGLGTGYWEGYQGVLRDLVSNGYFTPKPAGVSVDYTFNDGVIFALGTDTTYLKGLGEGSFVSF